MVFFYSEAYLKYLLIVSKKGCRVFLSTKQPFYVMNYTILQIVNLIKFRMVFAIASRRVRSISE